ncbi:MAG: hypothetical protein IPP66_21940 [Anaerolineales bacterium]|nr:hypothetical protein [Anaerolineales bacterium]
MQRSIFPLVDFKFKNDTPYWILMETYMGNGSLTWKFYSTSDGRTTTWETTGPVNVVPAPSPVYEENSDLKKNDMKQVDWAANGADVTVTRTVMRDGGVLLQDQITTHYQPWQAICEYGPDSKDPEKLAKEQAGKFCGNDFSRLLPAPSSAQGLLGKRRRGRRLSIICSTDFSRYDGKIPRCLEME